MNERSPTRAALLEMQDERHAMREGYVFLDEKCLLLAGEMLRQLGEHARLARALHERHEAALRALAAALGRHGLQGLQVHPAAPIGGAVRREAGSLMGVSLVSAAWQAHGPAPAAAAPESPPVWPSPEARACRAAFAALLEAAAPLAAVSGNLERLSQEYRRSVRRARALQDVLLPELERALRDVDTALEELEQQDLISMRVPGRNGGDGPGRAAREAAGAAPAEA